MSVNKKQRSKKEAVLTLFVSIALLIAFFYFVPLFGVLDVLRQADIKWFAVVVGLSFVNKAFIAQKFRLFLGKQDIHIPFFQFLLVNITAEFYSFFSPLSSVGTLVRWRRLIPAGKAAEGLSAFGAYRIFDVLFVLCMGLFWSLFSLKENEQNFLMVFAYFFGVFLLTWLGLNISPYIANWSERRGEYEPHKTLSWFFQVVKKVFRSIAMYRELTNIEFAKLIGIVLLSDLTGLFSFVLLAKSIDIPVSFVDFGWIRSFGILAALAPFTLPGGLGLREISVVAMMTGLGVTIETATAFSVLMYARSFVSALIGGVIEFIINIDFIKSSGYA